MIHAYNHPCPNCGQYGLHQCISSPFGIPSLLFPRAAKRVSGFEVDPLAPKPECQDLNHNPPTHLAIPLGQQYRHICPRCAQETVLRHLTMLGGPAP